MSITNSGILPFYEAEKWQLHNRAYSYGQISPLVEQVGVIPPFQFSRPLDKMGFNNPKLIRRSDGTEYDVQTPMLLTGFNGETVATVGNEIGYNHTYYPGSAGLPVSGLGEGVYYLRFEDEMGDLFYSEYFSWIQGISYRNDYIKIEWWHNEDIMFSGGKIKYQFPYKQRIWVQSDIGKPDYPVVEKVVNRDGVDFPTQTISYKLHRFQFLATEHMLDAMYLIRAHDAKVVTHMGKVIGEGDFDKIYSFLLTPEWLEQGDLATVDVEFRTNKVVIVNGRSYDDLDYEVEECECFNTNYDAIAWVKNPSAEYTGGYWTDEFGANHSFTVGQYVIVENSVGISSLRQWNGSSYNTVLMNARETVCTVHDSRNPYERESKYLYRTTFLATLLEDPFVTSESAVGSVYTISGDTFENTLIEVWLRTDDGDILQGTYTDADFYNGITFDASGSNAYTVRARTAACPNMGEADWVGFEGIGWWEIENTFEVP